MKLREEVLEMVSSHTTVDKIVGSLLYSFEHCPEANLTREAFETAIEFVWAVPYIWVPPSLWQSAYYSLSSTPLTSPTTVAEYDHSFAYLACSLR